MQQKSVVRTDFYELRWPPLTSVGMTSALTALKTYCPDTTVDTSTFGSKSDQIRAASAYSIIFQSSYMYTDVHITLKVSCIFHF